MARAIKSFSEFKQELESNRDLQQQFRNDPVAAVQNVPLENPLGTDKWIYRVIVCCLGLTILAIVIGVLLHMPIKEDGIPTILTALGSAAIGAIAGLLVTPQDRKEP